MYCSFSTLVAEAIEYGITMLLMSNALLPFFFLSMEFRVDGGIDCEKPGVGLGVDVGVEGEDTTVGSDKLRARFCSWAASKELKQC